jgi:hypothetical protein
MEKILGKNAQEALKKLQDTKNKEHDMAQKQIKELRENFKN